MHLLSRVQKQRLKNVFPFALSNPLSNYILFGISPTSHTSNLPWLFNLDGKRLQKITRLNRAPPSINNRKHQYRGIRDFLTINLQRNINPRHG